MGISFSSVLVGSEDPTALAAFYSKFLGEPAWSGGEFRAWQVGAGYLTVGPHDQVKGKAAEPARILIGFDTDDVQGAFDRAIAAGAQTVQEPYHPEEAPDMWLSTLSDPDGNYFQFGTPFIPPAG